MADETKNTTHTPGPWRFDRSYIRPGTDPDGMEFPIARIGASFDDCERRANARLIAAAPELLAACEDALVFLDKQREGYNAAPSTLPRKPVGRGPLALKVAAAIAKARGEVA